MSKRGKEQVAKMERDLLLGSNHLTNIVGPDEVSGYGLAHGSKGWLAVRVSNLGVLEVLTPKRNGLDEGVSKPLALQQMMSAQREYVLGLK